MPMPTVKQTEDFYDMLVAAARKKRARMAMDAEPVGTPPDAPGGNYTGKLIEALFNWAASELTPEQTAALHTLIENNTDQRGGVAKDDEPTRIPPKSVERAVDILRSKGVDEGTLGEVYKICGVEKPTGAMDCARRERHAEATPNNSRTPHASSATQPCASVRSTPRPARRASYDAMFPQAQRLG